MTQYLCIYDLEHFTRGDSVEDAYEEMCGTYTNVDIDECEFFEIYPLEVEREVVWSIKRKGE